MSGCYCIGPQNGAPACPCQMRNVRIVDGRYVMTQDLGPAPWHGSLSEFCKRDPAPDAAAPMVASESKVFRFGG